jgi:hypothetical protein
MRTICATLGRAEAGFALRDGADGGAAGPERVNASAIELSLTPACRKNAGTLPARSPAPSGQGRCSSAFARPGAAHEPIRSLVAELAGQEAPALAASEPLLEAAE